ncbi:CCR4-NOT transcription complex subunit 10-like isoform X2 [Sinocyclocheilus anshuiensis]|uniref:CCR4-NOT transcription complex subunit 10 n=1 Tax=Sinocyclocheilus anshuiensis TaxID=1608454 RepID=A0A671LMW4_9TELE|nr:PREDICTED: CCR4-NOT transcription complex subunit 10-like isoform X2 [Sinocyclocheilus anshuiensis]
MAETGSDQAGDMKHDSISSPGISDQEKETASNAFEAFKAGSHDESLKHLDSLQELNKEDYKVTMNKAITEFYKSGQTTTSTLKQTLITLKNQMHTAVDDIDGLDDVENSILYYNQAVIHYHMRQYSEAISIGEKLYQFLEPFEKFAQAVCFLLVDLYLLTFQPEKALHLLAVLEKLTVKDGNSKNGKGESTNSTNKESTAMKAEFTAMVEAAKSKMHQYKVRAYIQMKSLKACKREIKSVMNTSGNSAPSLFLKSNFEYLRGNYRKAVKLLNSSNIAEHPGPLKTGECVRCMFWNNLGCIHFAMGKHNLGLFYFKKALQENDHICAQLGDGSNGQAAKKFTGIPMCALLANKRYELLYNCGIQLLHIGRPLAAFECLMEAVQVYHSNPRLWLRLAECCITANKGSSEQETKGLPSKKGIVQAVVGQGYHRKIVLASQSTQNTIYSEGQSAAIPVASMEFAAICLRNALLLLPEHQQHDSKPDSGSKSCSQSGSTESGSETSDACSGKTQEGDKFIPAAPSSPLRKQEVENLRCSILACSAYVALALGDNLMALNHAEKLLHQTKLSGSLKFLGHLYAAEALISLDRISDAIAHLNPENVTDVSLGVTSSEQDQGSDKGDLEPVESSGKQTSLCYPSSVSSARATMLFNLGSAYCLRSEYEKARKCLHRAASVVNTKEIPPEAILLGVYLELQNGNTQLALQIIKRNQLLPSVKPASSPDLRKKPLPFQSSQPVQPIQTPSSFTQVQRK